MVGMAHAAGVPAAQIENFTKSGYIPLPWAMEFHAAARRADKHDGPVWIGLGGARGPGKSHATFAQVGLDDCQRQPNLKVLFLRKIQKTAGESMEDLAATVYAHTDADIKKQRIDFGNGSRILVGGFLYPNQIMKYIGVEYDVIVVEEATSLTEDIITKLRGSLRTSKPHWRPRVYLTTNPGGVGLLWFKSNFVMPYRHDMTDHRFIGGRTCFFPGVYKDNPFLNDSYIDYLEGIQGNLGKAWREGDWDVFEGMAFPNWNYDIHTIEPFTIPTHWPKWRAVDWGRAAPFACLWAAKDLDIGRIYLYREAYETGLSDTQQARLIRLMTPPDEIIRTTYADPSMWTKKSRKEQFYSTADEYRDEGVILTRADNDRLMGVRKINNLLGLLPDGKPGLQVFRSMDNFIRTFPALPTDELRPEDVDTDSEDHLFDALKYLLSNTKAIKKPKEKKQQRSQFEQLARMSDRL